MRLMSTITAALLLSLLLSVGTGAQHEDLAGTWIMVPEESTGPDDGRTDGIRTFIPVAEMHITAHGDTLRLEHRAWDDGRGRRPEREWRYQIWILDGQPHTDPADETVTFICRREGTTLTVRRNQLVSMGFTSQTWSSRRVWRLIEGGGKLVVEEWLPRSPDSGPPQARLVYKKVRGD
jgi:hypothetical protein